MLKSYLAEGNVVVLEFGRHPAVEGAKPMATQLNEYREHQERSTRLCRASTGLI